ncbi:MAG: hypothetical protein RLZZ32_1156, partial [Cyanobacteriota bacterium]
AQEQQQRRIEPATNRRFEPEEDYDYVEVEQRREREPLRQRRYLDEEPQQRRYVRDESPLDVEPYEPYPDERSPRRRESSSDPW